LSEFIATLQPLQHSRKLGPVLFQLPPFLKCDLTLLKEFLKGLPGHFCAAFEFRHTSWFSDEVYGLLRRANAALCGAESEKLVTPDVQTADFFYLRLRKERYSPKARREVAVKVADLARRGDVFVYFKHGETPEAALHAQQLLASIDTP